MRHLVVALLATLVFAGDAFAQAVPDQRRAELAFRQFEIAVAAYARLHHELDRTLGSIPSGVDGTTAQRTMEARADAIRRARPEPRRGALFTRELAPVIRRQIATALRAQNVTISEVLFDELAEGNEGGPVILRVNAPFPWQGAVGIPLCVNKVLPQLPEELQYRFVSRDLVLVDLLANLIVDILPDALGEVRAAPKAGR